MQSIGRIEGMVRSITPSSKALRTDLVCLGTLRKPEEICTIRDDYKDLLPSDHRRVAMGMLLIIHIPRHLPSVSHTQEKVVEAMEDIFKDDG
jgi:hypothetical protein